MKNYTKYTNFGFAAMLSDYPHGQLIKAFVFVLRAMLTRIYEDSVELPDGFDEYETLLTMIESMTQRDKTHALRRKLDNSISGDSIEMFRICCKNVIAMTFVRPSIEDIDRAVINMSKSFNVFDDKPLKNPSGKNKARNLIIQGLG